jgi:hypothetical protein
VPKSAVVETAVEEEKVNAELQKKLEGSNLMPIVGKKLALE